MKYEHDVFYDPKVFSIEEKKTILKDAKEKCFNWWVDELVGIQRQKIGMSFEQILTKLDEECHFVIIHRKGFKNLKDTKTGEYCFEVGFSTFSATEPTYYLWIWCDEDLIPYFEEKYKLELL